MKRCTFALTAVILWCAVAAAQTRTVQAPKAQDKAKAPVNTGAAHWEQAGTLTTDKKVTAAVFSPTGKHIAAASPDGSVSVWETEEYKLIRTVKAHEKAAYSLTFLPDGKTVVSVSQDGSVKATNVETGEEPFVCPGHADVIHTVVASPDGKFFATAGKDTSIRFWDAKTGLPRGAIPTNFQAIESLAISPNGKVLAAGGRSIGPCLWDLPSGKARGEPLKTGDTSAVSNLSFSKDGSCLAFGNQIGRIGLWRISDLKQLYLNRDHAGETRALFSADGKTLLSFGRDRKIKALTLATLVEADQEMLPDSVWTAAVSPDGKMYVVVVGNKVCLMVRKPGPKVGAVLNLN